MAKSDETIQQMEQKIRERLNDAGGFAGHAMRLLDSFFSEYPTNPRPELFTTVCATINDLNLMHLPEHRFGLAGGLAAVMSLNPEESAQWKKQFPALLCTAERLLPPVADTSCTTVGQVEYLWLWWMVTRDEAVLSRVIRMAHMIGEVGSMAKALMLSHPNIPRIREVLETEAKSWNVHQQVAVDVELHALASALAHQASVLLVGRDQGGSLVIVTSDGSRPDGCPPEAICRAPTKEERDTLRAIQEQAEDP